MAECLLVEIAAGRTHHSKTQSTRNGISVGSSALEVIFNEMRYINLRFTYLLTYLLPINVNATA